VLLQAEIHKNIESHPAANQWAGFLKSADHITRATAIAGSADVAASCDFCMQSDLKIKQCLPASQCSGFKNGLFTQSFARMHLF